MIKSWKLKYVLCVHVFGMMGLTMCVLPEKNNPIVIRG